MSHYSKIKMQIKDLDCLVKALIEMGWTKDQIEVHNTATNLYGYQGDKREQVANVIIRRKYVGSMSNDLGFVKVGNAYEAIISEYDSHKHNAAWLKKLTQMYGVTTSMKKMVDKKLKMISRQVVDGKVVMTFRQ